MPPRPQRSFQLPAVEALPPYLGFGRLDSASAGFDGGRVTACYRYEDGDVAYAVDWSIGRCQLEARYQEVPVVIVGARDLQGALFQSFLGMPEPAEDPRFMGLCQDVIEAGNVYFSFPRPFRRGEPGTLYYPAGLLFALRLPLFRENLPAWDVFRALAMPRAQMPMQLHAESRGAIVSPMAGGSLDVEEITLLDFVTPLCSVVEACRVLGQHHLIAKGQTRRLVVMDASRLLASGAQVYQGHVDGGPTWFAVLAADADSERSWPGQIARAGVQLGRAVADLEQA